MTSEIRSTGGNCREFIPNNPIIPASKGNKRVGEIQNLSLPGNAQRNKILHLFYTRTGIKSVLVFFFPPGKRAEALERFAESSSRQRDNLNIKGKNNQ